MRCLTDKELTSKYLSSNNACWGLLVRMYDRDPSLTDEEKQAIWILLAGNVQKAYSRQYGRRFDFYYFRGRGTRWCTKAHTPATDSMRLTVRESPYDELVDRVIVLGKFIMDYPITIKNVKGVPTYASSLDTVRKAIAAYHMQFTRLEIQRFYKHKGIGYSLTAEEARLIGQMEAMLRPHNYNVDAAVEEWRSRTYKVWMHWYKTHKRFRRKNEPLLPTPTREHNLRVRLARYLMVKEYINERLLAEIRAQYCIGNPPDQH